MIVLGEVSLIPAETGLLGGLGRKLRKVHFVLIVQILSTQCCLHTNLKNESN